MDVLMDVLMGWMWCVSFFVQDLLEDFQEFGLLYFAVAGEVDGLDELLHFWLADLLLGIHVLEGRVDEAGHLVHVQAARLVRVVLSEHRVHRVSQLLVGVGHAGLLIIGIA